MVEAWKVSTPNTELIEKFNYGYKKMNQAEV